MSVNGRTRRGIDLFRTTVTIFLGLTNWEYYSISLLVDWYTFCRRRSIMRRQLLCRDGFWHAQCGSGCILASQFAVAVEALSTMSVNGRARKRKRIDP